MTVDTGNMVQSTVANVVITAALLLTGRYDYQDSQYFAKHYGSNASCFQMQPGERELRGFASSGGIAVLADKEFESFQGLLTFADKYFSTLQDVPADFDKIFRDNHRNLLA